MEILLRKGVTSILAAPLLLFSAGHAKVDIPTSVRLAADKRGIFVAGQTDVLGSHQQIVDLSLRRYKEVLGAKRPLSAFVLVGRGASYPEAQAAAKDFLANCQSAGKLAIARLAYLAMAEPKIEQELDAIAEEGVQHVTLVPHLLFHGELIEKCQRIVKEFAARYPNIHWHLANRLGPDPAVVAAFADRIRAARRQSSPGK